MEISSEKLPRGQVKLKVELTPEEMKPHLEQAAFLISEKIKISGFRPGKAPYQVVKQQVGAEKIWQEAIEPAVKKTLIQALNQEKLLTVGSPKIDILKLAPNNPFIYAATISLLPQVKLADYKNIKVERKKVKVTDEQVNKALADLQKMRHKEVLVNRAAQKGDKVEIDFQTFLEKVAIEQGEQKKFPLIIGGGTFIPGFEEKLIGLKAGETKAFQLKYPENFANKNLANRLVDFKVKCLAVYKIELPALNDEFAQSLGEFKNFEELKNQIKENLTKEAQDKEEQRLEEEILDKIIVGSAFDDIPDILVSSETKKMVAELEQNIARQGIKFEDYLNHLKKRREDLLLDFTQPAMKRIKSALAIREIGKIENIKVTDKEVEEEIKKIQEIYPQDEKVKELSQKQDYKDYLRNVLTSRRVVDFLKRIANH